MLCQKNSVDFVQKGWFGSKKQHHCTFKNISDSQRCQIFFNGFLFLSSKDQLKMYKVSILGAMLCQKNN
jgi:hypothetical protein